MSFNVFFAWQMDTPTKLNRWFIETAIKSAIKRLRAEAREQITDELKLEPAPKIESDEPDEVNPDLDATDTEIVYQWGAHGHVGATLIAETILERIEACGVFIADLTFSAIVKTADNREKKTPNSNVLIEVGAASRSGPEWDRMILVLNTAFGQVEELPFDLRHRQCQVRYTLTAWDDPERPRKAKELAEGIADILRPMYQKSLKLALQQRDKAAESALAGGMRTAEEERDGFEKRVLEGKFYNFKAANAILTVSITPLTALKEPLDFGRIHNQVTQFFSPMTVDGGSFHFQHRKKSITAHTSGDITGSMTEWHETGSLFVAYNMLYGRDTATNVFAKEHVVDGSKPYVIPMHREHYALLYGLMKYLNGMIDVGIRGTALVSISILNARNLHLSPGEYWQLVHEGGRACEDQHIRATTVPIPLDAALSDAAILDAITRPLKEIWRSCGHHTAPTFNTRGHVGWMK